MRNSQDINSKERLVKHLQEKGVAASASEAERLAEQMLSTSDKVKKQHDAHRRATEAESSADGSMETAAVNVNQTRDDRETSHTVSDETLSTIEKQRRQQQSIETDDDTEEAAKDQSSDKGDTADHGVETASTDDETDENTVSEESSTEPAVDEQTASEESSSQEDNAAQSRDDDTTSDDDDLAKKREEADESDIDLGNVFDSSS